MLLQIFQLLSSELTYFSSVQVTERPLRQGRGHDRSPPSAFQSEVRKRLVRTFTRTLLLLLPPRLQHSPSPLSSKQEQSSLGNRHIQCSTKFGMGRLPENVYEEYKARRRGVIRALTSDVSHRAQQGGRDLFTTKYDLLSFCQHLTHRSGALGVGPASACCCSTPPAERHACTALCPIPCRLIDAQVDKFFSQCDPERENLCLYGLPDGTWAVDLPAEEVPPEIPEPALGINFARDGMQVRCAVELGQHLLV